MVMACNVQAKLPYGPQQFCGASLNWLKCNAGCVIKGATKVGLNLVVFTVHPMRVGGTLMSSFLFNVALVLLATQAAIQFCAQAFELYADNSAIQKIWGGQVRRWVLSAALIHMLKWYVACRFFTSWD